MYCQWTSITYITEKSIVNTGSTAKLTCKVSYPIDFQGSISWLKVNKTNDEDVSSVVLSNGNAVNVQDSRFLLRQDINIIGTRLNSNSYTLMVRICQHRNPCDHRNAIVLSPIFDWTFLNNFRLTVLKKRMRVGICVGCRSSRTTHCLPKCS